jgi:hypothetical protein
MTSQSPSVFIAYPAEFGCYAKFKRKIHRILSSLERYKILYISDPRDFISNFVKEESRLSESCELINMPDDIKNITHAIIFDDGTYFGDLKELLESYKIVYRTINIIITKVVNVDYVEKYDVYIGRGSGFGNPYAIGFDGDRDEVIRMFNYDFDRDLLKDGVDFKNRLNLLKGKILGCHCKPLSCHGDILAEYLNSQDDGR